MDVLYINILIKTTDSKGYFSDIYGTGFLWLFQEKAYIVTCKHVLTGMPPIELNTVYHFNKITIFWKSNKNQKIRNFSLDLLKNGKPIWFEHTNHTVDMVVIPFPENILNEEICFLSFSNPEDNIYSSNCNVCMHSLKNGNYDETLSYVAYIGTLSESLNKTMHVLLSEYEFPILMTSYPGQSGTLIYQKEGDCEPLGILSKTLKVDEEKSPITIAVKIGVLDEILANNK